MGEHRLSKWAVADDALDLHVLIPPAMECPGLVAKPTIISVGHRIGEVLHLHDLGASLNRLKDWLYLVLTGGLPPRMHSVGRGRWWLSTGFDSFNSDTVCPLRADDGLVMMLATSKCFQAEDHFAAAVLGRSDIHKSVMTLMRWAHGESIAYGKDPLFVLHRTHVGVTMRSSNTEMAPLLAGQEPTAHKGVCKDPPLSFDVDEFLLSLRPRRDPTARFDQEGHPAMTSTLRSYQVTFASCNEPLD